MSDCSRPFDSARCTVDPDPAAEAAVREVAPRLAPDDTERSPSVLETRRAACRDLDRIADLSPAAGRLLAPTLAATLRTELTHRDRASSTELFLGAVSREIQSVAASLLADVAGPRLVRLYDAADDASLAGLLGPLRTGLERAETDAIRVDCLRAVAAVGRVAPDRVVATLDAAALAPVVADRLSEASTVSDRRAGAYLALLLAVRGDAPPPEADREGLEAACTADDCRCRTYATVVRAATERPVTPPDLTAPTSDVQPIPALVDALVGDDRDADPERVARALGELGALGATDRAGVENLRKEVQCTAGWDRDATASALGYVLAASHVEGKGEEILAHLLEDLSASTGPDRWAASRVLGEVAATGVLASGTAVEVHERLRRRVRATSGRERRLPARALGFVVATPDGDPVVETLADRVHGTVGRDRREAARALGELAGAVPDRFDAPARLVESLDGSTDWAHWTTARALGEVIAARRRRDVESVTAPLAERVRVGTSRDRRLAAQALGEVAAAREPSRARLPAALLAELDGATGREAHLAERAVGEAVAAVSTVAETRVGDGSLVDALVEAVDGAAGRDRWLAAEALGFVASILDDEAPSDAHVGYVEATTDRDRRLAARALGLAVAADRGDDAAVLNALLADVVTSSDLNRWQATRLLGEVIVAVPDLVPARARPEHLRSRVVASTDDDRPWIAQTLGTYAATCLRHENEDPIDRLADRVVASGGPERRLAAHTLGEVLAHRRPDGVTVPAGLVDRVRDRGPGEDRWLSVWALGVVTAAGSPVAAIETTAGAIRGGIPGGDERAAVIERIARATDVGPEAFLTAIDAGGRSDGTNPRVAALRPYLEMGERVGRRITAAFRACLVNAESVDGRDVSEGIRTELRRGATAPGVRANLVAALTQSTPSPVRRSPAW